MANDNWGYKKVLIGKKCPQKEHRDQNKPPCKPPARIPVGMLLSLLLVVIPAVVLLLITFILPLRAPIINILFHPATIIVFVVLHILSCVLAVSYGGVTGAKKKQSVAGVSCLVGLIISALVSVILVLYKSFIRSQQNKIFHGTIIYICLCVVLYLLLVLGSYFIADQIRHLLDKKDA